MLAKRHYREILIEKDPPAFAGCANKSYWTLLCHVRNVPVSSLMLTDARCNRLHCTALHCTALEWCPLWPVILSTQFGHGDWVSYWKYSMTAPSSPSPHLSPSFLSFLSSSSVFSPPHMPIKIRFKSSGRNQSFYFLIYYFQPDMELRYK